MAEKQLREKPAQRVWRDFESEFDLTERQLAQFKDYAALLLEWNCDVNLTAIDSLAGVVSQHFADSMMLAKQIDLSVVKTICDVGSGGGFPGLPLKILYPHLNVMLIEVKQKKRQFLETVLERLGLVDVEVVSLDWRTFLRTTEGEVDYFVTKAALHEDELIRMFRSNCAYKTSKLVYWASADWEPLERAEKYIASRIEYKFKRRQRQLIVFADSEKSLK
jgi:16S rRNA (guanine(527)-N(7))-methyltransferase RsmG